MLIDNINNIIERTSDAFPPVAEAVVDAGAVVVGCVTLVVVPGLTVVVTVGAAVVTNIVDAKLRTTPAFPAMVTELAAIT